VYGDYTLMKTAAAGVGIGRIAIPKTLKVISGGKAIQYIGMMESVTKPGISAITSKYQLLDFSVIT
jgi:hypothetical protein